MRIRTKSSIRGIRDIRTRSGKVGRAGVPYMAYMNISCLEMEKARREKEKFSAQSRIKNIDGRLAEIEAEKADLLVCLGERTSRTLPNRTNVPDQPAETAATGKQQGFKIRY
jgi:hypothetical protein